MKTQEKFSLTHRLLHWAMALAMTILFITGFLRMYWMGKAAVANALVAEGIEVSKDTAKAVYKTLREPMWDWHVAFAFIMIVAFLARIIYMTVKGIRFPNPFKSKLPFKERLQGITYVYFYLFVLVQAVTGICLKFGFFPSWKGGIEATHKLGIYWFPIFILLHIAGVVLAENSNQKGITSKMIGG